MEPTKTYFILHSNAYVKIGISRDPGRRVKEMQTGNPEKLRIAMVIHGDREEYYHRKYAHYRLRHDSEWFSVEGELADFLGIRSRAYWDGGYYSGKNATSLASLASHLSSARLMKNVKDKKKHAEENKAVVVDALKTLGVNEWCIANNRLFLWVDKFATSDGKFDCPRRTILRRSGGKFPIMEISADCKFFYLWPRHEHGFKRWAIQ